MAEGKDFRAQAKQVYRMMIVVWCVVLVGAIFAIYALIDPSLSAFNAEDDATVVVAQQEIAGDDWDAVANGIHLRTGFVAEEGYMAVVNNCTNCHSAKLVTQNRMTKERWLTTIRWMQETQNLWDLGVNEEIIVNYLGKHYAPTNVGRREALSKVEWYDLK